MTVTKVMKDRHVMLLEIITEEWLTGQVRSVFPEKKNLTEIQKKSRRRDLEVRVERSPHVCISKGR